MRIIVRFFVGDGLIGDLRSVSRAASVSEWIVVVTVMTCLKWVWSLCVDLGTQESGVCPILWTAGISHRPGKPYPTFSRAKKNNKQAVDRLY